MEKEEMKAIAKRNVVKLDSHLRVLMRAVESANILRKYSVNHQLHRRAINATKALDGLNGLIDDLNNGKAIAMEILGAKKVPIDNQDKPKLKLIQGGKS